MSSGKRFWKNSHESTILRLLPCVRWVYSYYSMFIVSYSDVAKIITTEISFIVYVYIFSYCFDYGNKRMANESGSIINTPDCEQVTCNICAKHERTENIHNFCIFEQLLAFGNFERIGEKK